jgi:hypothetical protein
MMKMSVREVARLAAILGLFLANLLLLPEASRARNPHEGKFSVGAGSRARVYTNATSVTQKVLVTICVTTAPPGTASVDSRDDAGALVDALTNVRFGQCRSGSADLASLNNISVGAGQAAVAGNYFVSVLP